MIVLSPLPSAEVAKAEAASSDARRTNRLRRTEALRAFASAQRGDRSIRIDLVKEGLIARLAALFGLARRRLQRLTGLHPRFGSVKADDVLAAAERIAADCAANVPREQREAVADAIRTTAFFSLNAIYLGNDLRAQSRRFRAMLRLLATPPARSPEVGDALSNLPVRRVVRAFSRVADTASELRDLLTLDQRTSPVFRKIEAVPDREFRALFDFWPELSSAISRIWTRLSSSFSLPTLSEGERQTFDTLLLTSLVLFCADESTAESGEAFRTLIRGAITAFERTVNQTLAFAEIAIAVRGLLPERESAPA